MPFQPQPNQALVYRSSPKFLSGDEVARLLEPLGRQIQQIIVDADGQRFQGPWAEFVGVAAPLTSISMINIVFAPDSNRPQMTLSWQLALGQVSLSPRNANSPQTKELESLVKKLILPEEALLKFEGDSVLLAKLIEQVPLLQVELDRGRQLIGEIRAEVSPRLAEIAELARTAHVQEAEARKSAREAATHERAADIAKVEAEKARAAAKEFESALSDATKSAAATCEAVDLSRKHLADAERQMSEANDRALALLNISTVASLDAAFSKRSQAIQKYQWLWVTLVVAVNSLLVYLSFQFIKGLEGAFRPFIASLGEAANQSSTTKALPTEGLGWFYVAKLLVSLPLIYLDYFVVTTFRENRELIERYEFKNAVTRTLHTYQNLIQNEGRGPIKESVEFVLRAVERIYEPPLPDPGMGERERKSLLSTIEKLGNKAIRAAAAAQTKPDLGLASKDKSEAKSETSE